MLIFLRIFTRRDSYCDIHENGPIPGKKNRPICARFPSAIITFVFELAFLEKRSALTLEKCILFRQKS